MTPEGTRSILLVDDDTVIRDRLARAFRDRSFRVRTAGSVEEAILEARRESSELALVDLRMPGGTGLDVVRALKALDPKTNVLVFTAYGSIATALEAVRLGATHYLTKPADVEEILAAFARAAALGAGHLEHEIPSLARVEWEHINRVLVDCGGNISQAARHLALHRRSLQRKLLKFPGGW